MKTQHSTSIERVFMQMCCIETGCAAAVVK